MTQNRRYRSPLDRNIERALRADELRGTPISLSTEELRVTGRRTEAREPIQVEAWVRHRVVYEEPRVVSGEAIAWTEGAVLVRWRASDDTHEQLTWVWASAVRRLQHGSTASS
jgi:hypothetical protein